MINHLALQLIERHEKLKLKAFLNGRGVPTIGWGHTQGVEMGQTITEAQAKAFLEEDIRAAEVAVDGLVKVPLTDNQRGALVCLTLNIRHNLRLSTLLRKLNAGDYDGAATEFERWDKGGHKTEKALGKRRLAERKLFEKPQLSRTIEP